MDPRLKLFSNFINKNAAVGANIRTRIHPVKILTKVGTIVLSGLVPIESKQTAAVQDPFPVQGEVEPQKLFEEVQRIALRGIISPGEEMVASTLQKIPIEDFSKIGSASMTTHLLHSKKTSSASFGALSRTSSFKSAVRTQQAEILRTEVLRTQASNSLETMQPKQSEESIKVWLANSSVEVPFSPNELINIDAYLNKLSRPATEVDFEKMAYHMTEALKHEKAAMEAWKNIPPVYDDTAEAQKSLPYIPEVLRWLIHRSAATFYGAYHALRPRHFLTLRDWFTFLGAKTEHLKWIFGFLTSRMYNLLGEHYRKLEKSGIFLNEKIWEALQPENIEPSLKIPKVVNIERWSKECVVNMSSLGLESDTDPYLACLAELHYYLVAFCQTATSFSGLACSEVKKKLFIRAIQFLYTVERCCLPEDPSLMACLKTIYDCMKIDCSNSSSTY